MAGIYVNRYKLPTDKFEEIIKYDPTALSTKSDQYYINWVSQTELKKKDEEIKALQDQKKRLKKEVEQDAEVLELKAKLKELKFKKTSEELARIEEELKNLNSEWTRDINDLRKLFMTCNDIKTKRAVQE